MTCETNKFVFVHSEIIDSIITNDDYHIKIYSSSVPNIDFTINNLIVNINEIWKNWKFILYINIYFVYIIQ